MRSLVFEAPMRPMDVARSMYLDYTTTQSIKFIIKDVKSYQEILSMANYYLHG